MITELNVTDCQIREEEYFEMVFSGDFTIAELKEDIKNKDIIKLTYNYAKGSYMLSYYSLRTIVSEPVAMELVGIGVTLIK